VPVPAAPDITQARREEALRLAAAGDTRAAEAILQEVAQQQTEQAGAAREAAQTWRELGALAYTRSTEAALSAYRQAAELAPGDAWTWIEISRLERQAGRLAEAEEAARRAREAAAAAGDERGGMAASTEVGDVRVAQGDLVGALTAYEAGQVIAERLARSDPGNAQWQPDLSVSWNKLGNVRRAQGDLAGALAAYEASRAICERLAVLDPQNAKWQRDLIVSAVKLAEVAAAQGEGEKEAANYRRALAVARSLAAAGRLAPVDAWMVEELERRLAAAEGR
jgi:tetratricopeptide (TPR) repeat protein